jgi:hypothetical protein
MTFRNPATPYYFAGFAFGAVGLIGLFSGAWPLLGGLPLALVAVRIAERVDNDPV